MMRSERSVLYITQTSKSLKTKASIGLKRSDNDISGYRPMTVKVSSSVSYHIPAVAEVLNFVR
jgi:hypothetical protein